MTKARITVMVLAVGALGLLVAGPADAAEKGTGCQVRVSGAVTAGWTGAWQDDDDKAGPVGAASDYWLSDSDLEEVVEDLAAPGEDKGKKLLQVMRKNPRIAILSLNCAADGDSAGDSGHIFIHPSSKSVYQDVPRKAWSYRVASERNAGPAEFVVSSLKVGKNHYRVTGGRIDLKKFNFDGVTGTFALRATSVKAEDKGQVINVEGSFNFPCTGAGSRCRAK